MKATLHAGRQGCANHNDRHFDYVDDKHIDNGKVKDNIYIGPENGESFKELELQFYKEKFKPALQYQNKKNKENRHSNRNRTIEDLYYNRNTKPEEIILQLGNKREKYQDGETFEQIVRDYIEQFELQYGSHCKILDAAIHMDETSIHAHIRRVWFVETENGAVVNESKALNELGFERPDLEKEQSRYNNPKISLTNDERKMFINICREHGVAVEKPRRTTDKHLTMKEYKLREMEKDIQELSQQKEQLRNTMVDIEKIHDMVNRGNKQELEELLLESSNYKQENEALKRTNEELTKQNKTLMEDISKTASKLQHVQYQLDEIERMKRKYKELRRAMEEAEKRESEHIDADNNVVI